MITHSIIQQEADDLKDKLSKEDVEIPSILRCMRPGIIILAWQIACPYITFSILFNSSISDVLTAVGFSGFVGCILLFAITNGVSFYLSLPASFRETSRVLAFISCKIKTYGYVYAGLLAVVSLFGAYSNMGPLAYLMPMMFVIVGVGFTFNADVGRYRLSVFRTVVESFNK